MQAREVIETEEEFLIPCYQRLPIVFDRGEGCYLWDTEGRRYLDFVAGIAVLGLGHSHPKVVAALTEQVGKLTHCSNYYYTESRSRLAALLASVSGGYLSFFTNSGAEAAEMAIKLARKYTTVARGNPEQYEILSVKGAFHGRTLAATYASAGTLSTVGFGPPLPGFRAVPFNDTAALEESFGPHVSAVMFEVVQGQGGGTRIVSQEFADAARRLCDRHGALLIADEVQCGVGRSGRFFAFEYLDLHPDIVVMGKCVGGGVPIGAILASPRVGRIFGPADHGSTMGGNPLATLAGYVTLQTMLEEGVIEQAARRGEYFRRRLEEWQSRQPLITGVGGLGLMIGVTLRESIAGRIVRRCAERQLLVTRAGESILRFVPPLIVTEAQIDEAIAIMSEVVDEITAA